MIGDTPVDVQWGRDSRRRITRTIPTALPDACGRSATLRERLRSPAPSNDFYVTANNDDGNRAAFAPLFDEVGDIPEILEPGGAKNGFLWIGPKGTVTPWHHDLTNNLLLQVVGRKRVRMVASEDTPAMRNHRHCYSLWRSDDLLPGPAQDGKPAVFECTIGPGRCAVHPDRLVAPCRWARPDDRYVVHALPVEKRFSFAVSKLRGSVTIEHGAPCRA